MKDEELRWLVDEITQSPEEVVDYLDLRISYLGFDVLGTTLSSSESERDSLYRDATSSTRAAQTLQSFPAPPKVA